MKPRGLELLAPARDAAIARQAIIHGADTIYIGGPSHGARASASNTIRDIAEITDLAHLYGAKVYVTLNTIIYDDELGKVERDVNELYASGVDALIVQDMSLLRMDLPPIDLHASTQCDIRTPEKAQFLSECGFSQLVLPRELSIDEIKNIRAAVDDKVALEAFVHGALCVSYSGDCQASCLAKGRSANRGECAQMCRLPYTLTDGSGHVIIRDKHLLSLRDLNRLDDIKALADAGISSFKIEGRLKDEAYVKNTVAAYRRRIDAIIGENPDEYMRTSYGRSQYTFTPDVNKSFNRGFTQYFIAGRPSPKYRMANHDTPKWIGLPVGTITAIKGNALIAELETTLSNGDGLGYFNADGQFTGFRLNRIEGNRLYPATKTDIKPGTQIYRNRDVKHDAMMAQKTAERLIAVDMTLTLDGESMLTLHVKAENGIEVDHSIQATTDKARTSQQAPRHKALSKLGGTPYTLNTLTDNVPDDTFIPASDLNELRQVSVAKLTSEIQGSYQRNQRRPENLDARLPYDRLTYHDNVANHKAEQFYREHGAKEIDYALETMASAPKDPTTVMTTRYCLRRELGACLRTVDGKKLPSPLYISNDTVRYRLDFDCSACQMHVVDCKR